MKALFLSLLSVLSLCAPSSATNLLGSDSMYSPQVRTISNVAVLKVAVSGNCTLYQGLDDVGITGAGGSCWRKMYSPTSDDVWGFCDLNIGWDCNIYLHRGESTFPIHLDCESGAWFHAMEGEGDKKDIEVCTPK